MSSALKRLALRLKDLVHTDAPPATGVFVLGVNLGGDDVTVHGKPWWGQQTAQAKGLQCPGAKFLQLPVFPQPHAGAAVRKVLDSLAFRAQTLEVMLPVPAGQHRLLLWLAEDYQSHWHTLTLWLNGAQVEQDLAHLPLGGWKAYGPYPVEGVNGKLNIVLDSGTPKVDAILMGLALYRA